MILWHIPTILINPTKYEGGSEREKPKIYDSGWPETSCGPFFDLGPPAIGLVVQSQEQEEFDSFKVWNHANDGRSSCSPPKCKVDSIDIPTSTALQIHEACCQLPKKRSPISKCFSFLWGRLKPLLFQGILQKPVEEDSGFGGGSPTASDGFSRTGSTRFRPKSERLEQWPEGDSTFSRLV